MNFSINYTGSEIRKAVLEDLYKNCDWRLLSNLKEITKSSDYFNYYFDSVNMLEVSIIDGDGKVFYFSDREVIKALRYAKSKAKCLNYEDFLEEVGKLHEKALKENKVYNRIYTGLLK